ncbi:MAG: FeoB-associated Cys-rich membrane protein [Desulfatibacillum sp.]|nr:FeoB-associated Cys-rich membrane protein [Desulfatibacillum sp.]
MQEIVVALIVFLAVLGFARSTYRNLTAEKGSCGCSCAGCGKSSGPCAGKELFPDKPVQK